VSIAPGFACFPPGEQPVIGEKMQPLPVPGAVQLYCGRCVIPSPAVWFKEYRLVPIIRRLVTAAGK
jgi:hypothetical protein